MKKVKLNGASKCDAKESGSSEILDIFLLHGGLHVKTCAKKIDIWHAFQLILLSQIVYKYRSIQTLLPGGT